MDKVTDLLMKGKDIAEAYCTSPQELAVWIAGTVVVSICVGFIAGRLTSSTKQSFGRQ